MHPSSPERRQLLHTIAGGATANLFPGFAPLTLRAAAGDFLLAENLTYLNTGTIGPTRRAADNEWNHVWYANRDRPDGSGSVSQQGHAAVRGFSRTILTAG